MIFKANSRKPLKAVSAYVSKSSYFLGLILDRKKFLDQLKSENTKFRPFGRYIGEFQRNVQK